MQDAVYMATKMEIQHAICEFISLHLHISIASDSFMQRPGHGHGSTCLTASQQTTSDSSSTPRGGQCLHKTSQLTTTLQRDHSISGLTLSVLSYPNKRTDIWQFPQLQHTRSTRHHINL